MEKWKKIPDYSRYEASTLGRIRTPNWKGGNKPDILRPALDNGGYLRTMLKRDDGVTHTIKVHRIIASTFLENIEHKKEVNHKNGIRSDNRLTNLEWVNHSENIKHSFKIGLSSNIGEKNPAATLTEKEVKEIRANYKYGRKSKYDGGETKVQIAKRYNTTVSVIKMIIQKRTWKHLL